jgi:hypothetical protein
VRCLQGSAQRAPDRPFCRRTRLGPMRETRGAGVRHFRGPRREEFQSRLAKALGDRGRGATPTPPITVARTKPTDEPSDETTIVALPLAQPTIRQRSIRPLLVAGGAIGAAGLVAALLVGLPGWAVFSPTPSGTPLTAGPAITIGRVDTPPSKASTQPRPVRVRPVVYHPPPHRAPRLAVGGRPSEAKKHGHGPKPGKTRGKKPGPGHEKHDRSHERKPGHGHGHGGRG